MNFISKLYHNLVKRILLKINLVTLDTLFRRINFIIPLKNFFPSSSTTQLTIIHDTNYPPRRIFPWAFDRPSINSFQYLNYLVVTDYLLIALSYLKLPHATQYAIN